MIVACPSCASPFQIPADQIAPLVQVACPSCGFKMILDFEAANDPSLREPGVQTTSAYRSADDYYSAVGQTPATSPEPVEPAPAAAPTQTPPKAPTQPAPAPARPAAPAQPPARPAAPSQPPAQAKPAAPPSKPPSGPQRSAKPASQPPARPSSQSTQAVPSVPAAQQAAAAAEAQTRSQAAPPKGRGVPKKTMIGVAPPRPTPAPQPAAGLDEDIPTQVRGFDLDDLDEPTTVRPAKEATTPLTGEDEGPTVVRQPSGEAPAARTPPHTPPSETASRQPDEKEGPEAVDPAAQSQPSAPVPDKPTSASPDVPPESGGGRRTLLLLLILLLIGVGGLVGLSWQDDGDPNPIPYVQKLIDKFL